MQPSTQGSIRLLIAVCLVLTIGLAVLLWAVQQPLNESSAPQSGVIVARPLSLSPLFDAVVPIEPIVTEEIAIPAALLRVDDEGNLIVDADTGAALEILHVALQQADDKGALSRLVNRLRQTPGGDAGHRAATLLIHYHEYHQRLAELDSSLMVSDHPAAQVALQQERAQLRAVYFSEEDAVLLFGAATRQASLQRAAAKLENHPSMESEFAYLRR